MLGKALRRCKARTRSFYHSIVVSYSADFATF
jgi:hypothetical protein